MTDDELRRLFADFRDELRGEMHTLRSELRQEIAVSHEETRRHIDVVNQRTRHEIGLLAEAIGFVREDLRRTESRLDEKIDQSTSDTQSLIRYSYAQLNQRIQAIGG